MNSSRKELEEMVDVAMWEWLSPHAARARVILVGAMLDLVDVGIALTDDNTQLVQSWIDDGWLRHPSAEELSDWNADKDKQFTSLVVPPFVLVRIQDKLKLGKKNVAVRTISASNKDNAARSAALSLVLSPTSNYNSYCPIFQNFLLLDRKALLSGTL